MCLNKQELIDSVLLLATCVCVELDCQGIAKVAFLLLRAALKHLKSSLTCTQGGFWSLVHCIEALTCAYAAISSCREFVCAALFGCSVHSCTMFLLCALSTPSKYGAGNLPPL